MGTVCKVETLMGIREVCLDHILKIHATLQEERDNMSKFIQKKQNPNDETFKKITKARKNLLDIVNGFFDRLENEVHQNFERFTTEHMQECLSSNKKLENMIEELENIEKELNGAEYIRVMLKVLFKIFNWNLSHFYIRFLWMDSIQNLLSTVKILKNC